MPKYLVNVAAVEKAYELIDSRQYVLSSQWSEVQPKASDEDELLSSHDWDEYSEWHLGLNDGATPETKGRYAFTTTSPAPAVEERRAAILTVRP